LALRQRAEELAAFHDTVMDFTVQQDLFSLLRTIVERSMALLDAPNGFIYLYDEATEELELVVDLGYPTIPGVRLKLGEGMAGRVAETRQSLIVDDYSNWDGRPKVFSELPLRAVIEAPMLFGGHLIGVLGVNDSSDKQRKFTEAEAQLLLLFAGQAASVVRDARLVQGLQLELDERSRAEASLREAETRYRTLVEQLPAIIYVDSAEEVGRTLYISPQITSILGYDPQEWSANLDLWTRMIHPDDRESTMKEYFRSNKGGEPFRAEYRATSQDGRLLWIRDEAVLIRDQSGKPLFWQGIMFDITQSKQAEIALRESEERYRRLFDLSPDAIIVHGGGKILLANSAALVLIGADNLDDIIDKPLLDIVHPDYRDLVKDRIRQQVVDGKVVPVLEEKFIRLDGTPVDVEVTAAPIRFHDSPASLVIFRDITKRKQADTLQDAVYQIALATESTRSLNDLFPRIHDIIASVMPAENFYITLYDEKENLLRFPYFRDAQDEPFMGGIQPGKGLTAYVLRTGRSLLCTQEVHDQLERQGEVILLGVPSKIWLGVPLIIESKTIGAMVVQHYSDPDAYSEREQHMLEFVSSQVAIAITRKQAEEALQASEASYRGLFDSVLEAVYIQDREGRFLDVNQGAVQMYGYPREFFPGKSPADIAAPGRNDMDRLREMVARAFEGEPQQFEFWGVRSNGEEFPKNVRLYKGEYFGQDIIFAMAEDITERKKAEDALRESEEKFRRIVEASPMGMHLYELQEGDRLVLIGANPSADRILGLEHAGLVDKVLEEAFPVLVGTEMPEIYRRAARDGTSWQEEQVKYQDQQISGSFQVYVFQTSPMRIAVLFQDVTERIRAEEAIRRRRQEAETLRQAAAAVSASLDMNQVLETILGSLEELVPFDSATIMLLEKDMLRIVAARGFDHPEELIGMKFPAFGRLYTDEHSMRTPTVLADAAQDARFQRWAGTDYVRGWMGIPMISRDKVVGCITIDNRLPGAYNEESAALVASFAFQAGAALDNAMLYDAEQKRRKEAEAMREVARVVSTSLDVSEIFKLMLEQLKNVLTYDTASVLLLGEGGQADLVSAINYKDEKLTVQAAHELLRDSPILEKMAHDLEPILIPDVRDHPGWIWVPGAEHVRCFMAAPIVTRGKMSGALMADSITVGFFGEDELRNAQSLAQHMSMTIENARLYQQAVQAAERRAILHQAGQEIARAGQDLEKVYEAVHRAASRLMPVEAFVISVLENNKQEISLVYLFDRDGRWPSKTFPASDGISGLVISTGEGIIIPDLELQPFTNAVHFGAEEEVRSVLAVPMRLGKDVTGMLSAQAYKPGVYTEDDQRLLEMLAANAAVALENARLFRETNRRLDVLETVNRISTTLRAAQGLEEMLPRLMDETLAALGAEAGVIWLYEPGPGAFREAAARGWFANLRESAFLPGEGIAGQVFSTGEAIISPEFASDERALESVRRQIPPGWGGACVPIRTVQETIGVLFVSVASPRQLDPESVNLLTTISEMAGNAIRRASLFEKSEQQIQRMAALRAIDVVISSMLDLQMALETLLELIVNQLHVDAADVLLLSPNIQLLEYVAGIGFYTKIHAHTYMRLDACRAGQAILERKTIHIHDLRQTPAPPGRRQAELEENFQEYYCVPLVAKGNIQGVLEIYHRSRLDVDSEWFNFLETIAGEVGIGVDNARLFEGLQRSNLDLSMAYDATIEGWSLALDLRDRETEGHTRRVTDKTIQLARRMGLNDQDLVHIRRGALLHDIGKMGIPDAILLKTGPLEANEWEIMRKHPIFAFDMLSAIPYLRTALDIPYCHHEWWDGTGYPRGLVGQQIPLSARIFAVVDVWDALMSDRPYRGAWVRNEVVDYMKKLDGKQFDPQVLKVFMDLLETNGEL